MRGRLGAAIQKEFRQFFRDPVVLTLVFWLYTVEIVLCALSLSFDLDAEPIGVLDRDRSHASLVLAERFDRTESFRVAYHPRDEREAAALLDAGKARFVLVLPQGYEEDRTRGASPRVQLLVDGSNSMTAGTALGIARRLLLAAEAGPVVGGAAGLGTSGLPADRSVAGPRAPPTGSLAAVPPGVPQVENRVRIWYNPDLRFVYFVVISMIALAAYMVGVIHPAASIVKEKESGTIEQVLVSPLRPAEFILAKTLPTLIIGLLNLGPALLIARAFGVPLRGDLPTFALLSAVFLVSAIAGGILIATWTRTLQQALLVAFFILFPILFLSGTMTPVESMPRSLQLLSWLSPLRHYMEATLSIFLKGVGLDVLWPHLVWMAGLGAVLLGASVIFFRRRLTHG